MSEPMKRHPKGFTPSRVPMHGESRTGWWSGLGHQLTCDHCGRSWAKRYASDARIAACSHECLTQQSKQGVDDAWARDLDTLERIFHAAVSKGDADGVEAALRLMLACDSRRGVRLYDELKTGLQMASLIQGT